MFNNPCPICKNEGNYKIIYKANFKTSLINKLTFSARRLPDGIHYQIVKCKLDNLVRSTPIIDPSKISSFYQESLMNYDENIACLKQTYLDVVKPILTGLNYDDKILEIGCGNGFLLEELYQLGFKNVFGLELSKDAINKAKSGIKEKIKLGTLNKNSFKSNQFSLILIFQTFDHIIDTNLFLQNCHKILKKGGIICIYNHNINSFSARFLREKSPIIDIEHTFFFSPKTLSILLKKNRFTVTKSFLPLNWLTIKQLIWLLPLPKVVKDRLICLKSNWLGLKLHLPLGNLCVIAIKND